MNYRLGFYGLIAVVALLGITLVFTLGGHRDNKVLDPSSEQADEIKRLSERLAAMEKSLSGYQRTLRGVQDRATHLDQSLEALGAALPEGAMTGDTQTQINQRDALESGSPASPFGALKGEDNSARRYEELELSFDEDPVGDPQEAVDLQVDIERVLTADDMAGLKVHGVECRSSQCKIEYETAGEFWDEEIDELEMSSALAQQMGGKTTLRYGRQQGEKKTVYLDLNSGNDSLDEDYDGPAALGK